MAIDLTKMTTIGGQKIEVHLEKPSLIKDLSEVYTQSELLEEIRAGIAKHASKLDGGTIHALLNTEGSMIVLTEARYREWQQNPNWGHRMSIIEDLISHMPTGSEFSGPSDELAMSYLEDPVAEKVAEEGNQAENCELCLVPGYVCPLRRANFDQAKFEAELAARKAVKA